MKNLTQFIKESMSASVKNNILRTLSEEDFRKWASGHFNVDDKDVDSFNEEVFQQAVDDDRVLAEIAQYLDDIIKDRSFGLNDLRKLIEDNFLKG